jgi:hypothetical protein
VESEESPGRNDEVSPPTVFKATRSETKIRSHGDNELPFSESVVVVDVMMDADLMELKGVSL